MSEPTCCSRWDAVKKDLTKSMDDLLNLKEEVVKGLRVASASKLGAGKDSHLHCFLHVNNHEKCELAEHRCFKTDASFVGC